MSVLTGTGGNDLLQASVNDESVIGLAGNDTLVAGARDASTLSGDAGDDLLFSASSADRLSGGDGVDTLSFDRWSSALGQIIIDNGSGTLSFGGGFSGIEKVVGTRFGDDLFIRAGAHSISGGGGDDVFRVWYHDLLSGDRFDGGAGSDTLAAFGDVDLTAAALSNFEKLRLGYNAEDLPAGSVHTVLSALQVATSLPSNLEVIGSLSVDHVVIEGSAGRAVDLSGWTFSSWATIPVAAV